MDDPCDAGERTPSDDQEPVEGQPLPNAAKAVIAPAKLTEYALNLNHDHGAPKARVFRTALGIGRDDAQFLAEQILHELPQHPVRSRKVQYTTTWRVDIPITGRNDARRHVITAWEMRDGLPHLVSIRVDTTPPAR